MLGRAKNLIQAALLITGNVLTSHFTLWRVTGGVGERPGAVLVHVLFSASGDFCCCAFSCFSILHKIWKLVLQLWPRRSSQCSVTNQHQTDLVMNEGEFWALGQGCWGCFAAFRACWAVGAERCQALWLWPQRVWFLTVMALVISDYQSSSSHLEELWLNERSISLSNFYLKMLSSMSTVEYHILSFWALLSVMQCCSWNDLFQLWGQFK